MERAISQPLQLNKVLKKEGIEKYFNLSCWLWLFAFFILPDAFGFRLGFLFSAKRIMLFVCYAQILINSERYNRFWKCIKSVKYLHIVVILYMFIRLYTGVLRTDMNTFFGEFLDGILVFYLFIYVLKYEISIDQLLKYVYGVFLFLSIYSFFEYSTHINLFAFLNTAKGGLVITTVSRSGSGRVMANCHHPIHFGIYITILFFLSCIDYKNNKINIFFHKPALPLAICAVFFSGSRGPLGIFLFAIFVILCVSSKNQRIIGILIFILSIIFLTLTVAFFINTPFGKNIMRMLTAIIDGIFNTEYSLKYGGEEYLQSTEYREMLFMIFKSNIFNPLLGKGVSYEVNISYNHYWIRSIDNAYIEMYVKLAYPGLIVFCILLISMLIVSIVFAVKTKNKLFIMCALLMIFYAINIWYVALMGTFMYIWMVYAMIFVAYEELKKKNKGEEKCNQNL